MTRTVPALAAVMLIGLVPSASPDAAASPSPKSSPSLSPSPADKGRRSAPAPRSTASPRPRSLGKPQKGSPPPKRVYGNQDLPSPKATPPDTQDATREAAPAENRSGTNPGEETGGGERYWRGRAEARRAAIREADENVRRLQEKVAALRNDLAPTNVTDPYREQTRRAQLGAAIQELQAAQSAAADARKAMDDLEEEARHKGIPPGWLREH